MRKADFDIDYDINIDIIDIRGEEDRYDAWTVVAQICCDDDGEECFSKKIRYSFPKESGKMDEDEEGVPKFVNKLVKIYKNRLKDDEEFEDYFDEEYEAEKEKMKTYKDTSFNA